VVVTGAIFAGALLYYRAVWPSIDAFVKTIDHADVLFHDFLVHYHPTGQSLLVTGTPSPGFFYSPFFAILLVPLGIMPLSAARTIWALLQLGAILALWALPSHHFLRRKSLRGYYTYTLLFALSFPLLHNFMWGQMSTVVTVLILLTFHLRERGHPIPAAIVLALASAIKYYPALFVLYFVLKKDMRFLVTFLATSLLCLVVMPVLTIGAADTVAFYRQTSESMRYVLGRQLIGSDANSQYMPHVVARLAGLGPKTGGWYAVSLLSYLVFGATLGMVLLLQRRSLADKARWSTVLLFLALPFVLKTSWPHYFVYLPWCQAVVANAGVVRSGRPAGKAVLVLALLSAALSSAPLFNLFPHYSLYGQWGCLCAGDLLVLIAAAIAARGASPAGDGPA
jgi:alpha-1,2-mannosyltransferase